MKLSEIKEELKNSEVTIEGYLQTKKEEEKDGQKAVLLSMREDSEVLYFRIKDDSSLWNQARKLSNGDKLTVTGILNSVKKAGDNFNYLTAKKLEKDDTGKSQIAKFEIVRKNGEYAFVEFMDDAFAIKKVRVNFATADNTKADGSKITGNVNLYLDFKDAKNLSYYILNGDIARKISIEKTKKEENPQYFPQPVFESRGGTPASVLAARGQKRADGMGESRVFSIEPSTSDKYAFVFVGKIGPSANNNPGIITPGKPERIIRIPVTKEDADLFAQDLADNVKDYEKIQRESRMMKEVLKEILNETMNNRFTILEKKLDEFLNSSKGNQ